MAEGLNDRQRRFCEGIVAGLDQKAAYVAAGYKARGASAASEACKLMRIPKVVDYIDQLRAEARQRAAATVDRVREEIELLALFDPGDVIDFSTNPPTLREPGAIPDRARRAIASVKVKPMGGIEYRFVDKARGLEMLARHLGMFEDTFRIKTEQGPPATPFDTSKLTDEQLRQFRALLAAGGVGRDAGQDGD